ncbi:hypothetical protein, variant 1 [Aphanomyces astaci]|uniref:Uncharacterized protein n=1 Tax=Aphanomyces astaci TaxID=112090 RepID=W4FI02_APHAT|nr:hypothetical protein, variant 1 [Aphanomyces astaci]ETV66383.1 hypothetical protein, variant 1 [Aphanomyces astaci]|eukprot:XP_009844158.1 hypothetical protein, variant 1 [Aphanomyces astaci]
MSDDTTSNRLAEKMLAGWTLLATNCPELDCCTPLMCSRKDKTKLLCVKCDKWYSTEEPAETSAATPTSSAPQATPHPPPPPPAASFVADQTPQEDQAAVYAARKKRRDATSSKLGEKMLQGWTLMGSVCPRPDCGTPFVRNRDTGQLFCVTCNQYAITEEQAAEQHAADIDIDQPSHDESSITTIMTTQPGTSFVAAAAVQPVAASQAKAELRNSADLATTTTPVDVTSTSAAANYALRALYHKLAAATAALEQATTDKEVCMQSRVLRDVAKAIKALHGVQSVA